MSTVLKAWNRFFFTPTLAHSLGVYRFFAGIVVFLSVLGVYPYRAIFYGVDAIVMPVTMKNYFAGHPMVLGYNFMPIEEPWLGWFLLGLLVAAAMLSLGIFSRYASVAVVVGLLALHNRNSFNTNAGDILLRINCTFLAFADCGAAFSFDRWLGIRRGKEGPEPRLISPWPVRLLQLQLAYLYLMTVALKLPGASWRDGTAMYYALRYLELQRFSFKYLFYYLWQIKLATWGVLVAETAMGTLVWFRKLRYPILATALLLHTGINLTMQFPIFQYVMMMNLVLFVFPEDLKRWTQRALGKPESSGSGNQSTGPAILDQAPRLPRAMP